MFIDNRLIVPYIPGAQGDLWDKLIVLCKTGPTGYCASMQVHPIKTRLFEEGEDLFSFVHEHIPKLKDGSILAIASKVVALAEGRVVELKGSPDALHMQRSGSRLKRRGKQKVALMRKESEWMRHVWGKWWLTVRDGMVAVNAGIDESNADGKLVLLPKDPFESAQRLYASLLQNYRIKNLGVIITDSRITPLRAGVVGVALGYAGFRGVRDYRGTKDLFGRRMEVTQTNITDSLATAATLVMGEGNECQPLVVITGAPVEWTDVVDRNELKIPREQDMFKHLFEDR